MKITFLPFLLLILLASCGVNKASFYGYKKYAPEQLNSDYTLFESMVKESHPGLYWYTSPGDMEAYFEEGRAALKDSMTERNFRKVLSYVYSKVNCGHSTIRASKQYDRRIDSLRLLSFPFGMKLWKDTAVVTVNLNRKDSLLTRGTVITDINGVPVKRLVDTLFEYLSSDGYNQTHKYQTLSNGGAFGTLYTTLFGLSRQYTIGYLDSLGRNRVTIVPVYDPRRDSTGRRSFARLVRLSKKARKKRSRELNSSLRFDSTGNTALMTLNSFANGYHLRRFFRGSFRSLREKQTNHLIIDVRGNGGGNVGNSTLLTRFLSEKSFKLADSLYAIDKKNKYHRYIEKDLFNRLFITFFTRRQKDGFYHFRYFEQHYFKPKQKNHFGGNVYILTGGNSFSATTLFTQAVMAQANVWVVGEETGGGAYGNTAWLIPEVTLPATKVRFRLPLFRLVINKNAEKTGRGIPPEIEVLPSVQAIREGKDYKMEKVKELIYGGG